MCFRFFVFSLVLVSAENVFAAACCGGGFASPSLIAGDDRAQLTTSIAQSQITDDVYANGIWKKRVAEETSQTFRIEGAHIFADRFQVGVSLPVVRRMRDDESSTGLGDMGVSVGYEYLPDWDYNPWRPKGLGFLQLVVPTGKSIYESDNEFALDSRGRGLWAVGAGTLLTKTFRRYDGFLSFDFHRAFSKHVGGGRIDPGWGGNLGLGGGYNLEKYRLGTSVTWSYEDPVDYVVSDSSQSSSGVLQRYATASVVASYLASDEWSGTVTYSDQTLFGSPVNTSLSRTVMLQVKRRWER